MNKARYLRSRWWVAASALGAFVAMFGALFARDNNAFDTTGAVEAAAPATQLASTTNRGVRPTSITQQSTRNVQPSTSNTVPGTQTTTTIPHTRTRAS